MIEDYIDSLEALNKEHDRKLQALGATFRDKELIPLCKRYKLLFSVGNGTFFFHPAVDTNDHNSWIAGDVPDAQYAGQEYLVPYLRVLNEEIEEGQYFGYLVDPIDEDDIK